MDIGADWIRGTWDISYHMGNVVFATLFSAPLAPMATPFALKATGAVPRLENGPAPLVTPRPSLVVMSSSRMDSDPLVQVTSQALQEKSAVPTETSAPRFDVLVVFAPMV